MTSVTASNRVLREVLRTELTSGSSTSDVRKKDFKSLASYNWQDKTNPTIIVPGSPARWTPKPSGTRVPQDTGLVMIDQNAYRNPKCPLEPLFRALFTEKPDFDPSDIDIVTDRNNFLKLFKFISGDDKPFKISVQRVGKTTLFTRTEESTSEYITAFRGFGHEFEKAYTKWPTGMENSTSNHRIVQYDFCGICCMVRFDVDAFTGGVTDNSDDADDGLSSLLGGISISKRSEVCDSSTFRVTKRGTVVPQSSLIEIKTRAASRGLNLADALPQLWFSDTPTLAVAYHRGGRFDEAKTTAMNAGSLGTWERSNVANLRKLAALLKIIIEEAELVDGGRCLVQGRGDGKLTIRRSSSTANSLPDDLEAKFY